MVLIALAIILYLAFGNMGGTSYTQQAAKTRQQARVTAQEISTRQLSILIAQYRVEQGRLPETPADLDNDLAFRDPWGGQITFTFEERGPGPTTVIYRSNGPDQEPGTADDVEVRDTLPY
jgi:type II secretory pathway pseudopilin PulG